MTLIIGYGNPLRGDDGIGWRVVQAVAEALLDTANVLTVHQLAPELAEPISRARVVVFVDAAVEGEPGEVIYFALDGDAGWQPALQPIESHLTTPGALLAIALDLFGRRPPAYIVTVVGESFELSESLSPAVEAAVPEAVWRVIALAERAKDVRSE
jgi:hydrogenase maturation protease